MWPFRKRCRSLGLLAQHSFAPTATTGLRAVSADMCFLGIGGTGKLLAAESVRDLLRDDAGLNIFLAGGLKPENIVEAVQALGDEASSIVGVDVSSGVETDGNQDLEKIKAFIDAAKSIKV